MGGTNPWWTIWAIISTGTNYRPTVLAIIGHWERLLVFLQNALAAEFGQKKESLSQLLFLQSWSPAKHVPADEPTATLWALPGWLRDTWYQLEWGEGRCCAGSLAAGVCWGEVPIGLFWQWHWCDARHGLPDARMEWEFKSCMQNEAQICVSGWVCDYISCKAMFNICL